MLYIENSSQVTKVSYKTIESNFTWDIENPTVLDDYLTSNTIQIPLIDREWSLYISPNSIKFTLSMIKNTNFAFIRPPYSREDHYCFEFSVNDMEKTSLGYKYIVHNQCMHDQHVSNIKQINGPCIIKAKVTYVTSRQLCGNYIKSENKMNALSDIFSALMLDSTYSDFTVIVKSKEFKVHKIVLSAHSPVFNQMFLSNMKEAADNKVEINDIEPCTFEKLLSFIYCGKIPEDINIYAMELFVAADKYGVEDLKNECEKYISLNVTMDNAMDIYQLSNLYASHYDLKKTSLEMIKKKLQDPIIVGNLETLDIGMLDELLKRKISLEKSLNELNENLKDDTVEHSISK